MEIALAVSGMLALLGGGAGLVAYYRQSVAGGNAAAGAAGAAAGGASGAGGFSGLASSLGVSGTPPPTVIDTLLNVPKPNPGAGVIASPVPAGIGRSSIVDTSTAAPPGYHAAPAAAPYVVGSGVLH
jgi:hypothetical protein